MLYRKKIFIISLLTAGILTACGSQQEIEKDELEIVKETSEERIDDSNDNGVNETEEAPPITDNMEDDEAEAESVESEEADNIKRMFGENCITEQTFEVELSEFEGKVWFVSFLPSENYANFQMQIVQNDKVLVEISSHVPENLAGKKFTSLDAVSFYDVNFDGNTDIVLLETYGDISFAEIHYAYSMEEYSAYFQEERDSWWFFHYQEQLSANISENIETLTVSEIRDFLSNGKKNGEFSNYQEAYAAIANLCQQESDLEPDSEIDYQLIYVNEDDIPELVCGYNGYYMSMYTYHDGTISMLMDQWGYGAMGNPGYEYVPQKNSLRNYNNDFAGLILYTTYMTIDSQYLLEVVTQIKTYSFDDANENGMPDDSEEDSFGNYSVSYINGIEVSAEECDSYNAGEYEYIEMTMSLAELETALGVD